MLSRVYYAFPPAVLLVLSLSAVAAAEVIRTARGSGAIAFNIVIGLTGLAVYFVPHLTMERDSAERVRRKLLWLLVLSGTIILAKELLSPFS